ncbi:MAG: translation initiation factor IF-2 subunit alpha [Nanoarchaeota archaeon]
MFYKKPDYPESDDIVLCTVKKILPHSTFVDLDEYGKEGMIHISEIAAGRIRNIRDYVRENKKVVCKVLNIDKAKGYIDLSLRRVNQAQRINKVKEFEQEQKAEKILEDVGKKLKMDLKTIYEKAGYNIINSYGNLTSFFYDIVNDKADFKKLNIPNNIANTLTEIVKEKIKPIEVSITGILKLESDASNGIELIKKTLEHVNNFNKNAIKITYVGAPRYRILVKAKDYKTAESILREASLSALEFMKKLKGKAEFIRA